MKYQEIYNGLNKKASNEQIKKLASIIGMVKRAAEYIPYAQALSQADYDKTKQPKDQFIYGDDKNRWVVAPTTKHRYDINKLPQELQDTLYQHLHLANLLKAWRQSKGIPYLTDKQNKQLNQLPESDAKYLHNRNKALQRIVDAYLSKNKTPARPNIKSHLYNLVYSAGQD